MMFGRGLNKFIKLFYICGLSCYPSFDGFLTGWTKKDRVVRYIPIGGLILLAVITSIRAYVHLLAISRPNYRANKYTILGYVSAPIVTMLIYAIQVIFLSPYFARICLQINNFERMSQKMFLIDPMEFRRHFMRRACIMLIAVALTILPWVLRGWSHMVMTFGTMTLRVFVFLAFIHAYFYVDILDYLLKCFVRHVDIQASAVGVPTNVQKINIRNRAALDLKAKITQWKLLHFELWEISESINNLFGWTTVAIFLHNFLFTINYMYIMFLRIPSEFFAADVMRKHRKTRL